MSLSGTWSDADGNTGPFAFGGSLAGSPRPAPAPATSIGVSQLAPSVYAGSGSAATVARSDHTHDDRYFTEGETTALVATRSAPLEVIVTDGAQAVTPDTGVAVVRQATTARAGRLDVSMVFHFNAACSAGIPVAYLSVDGVVLPSSLLPLQGGPQAVALRGVTATVLPAGLHNIGYALDCPSGNYTGGGVAFPGAATVIVIP